MERDRAMLANNAELTVSMSWSFYKNTGHISVAARSYTNYQALNAFINPADRGRREEPPDQIF